MLKSLESSLPRQVVAFTDSQTACAAIRRGSSSQALQYVVRDIFVWCLHSGVTLAPCWVPRESSVIREADARSRWKDVHGQRTPPLVFAAAQDAALAAWGRPISFDRQASHLNAMPPEGWGPRLPFNALWLQPGCYGVDMFLQPPSSWQRHVNFIHPAEPTIGRVLAFLPSTMARAIVVFPAELSAGAWWANWARVGGPGVLAVRYVRGFLVLTVDHALSPLRSNSI